MHGEQTVPTEDLKGAERLARYLTRGPMPLDVVEKVEGGRLRVRTPPDPRTGLVEKILDPLELIHALTTQIPDPGQHMVRYYGWYSNRSRGARASGGLRRGCRKANRHIEGGDPKERGRCEGEVARGSPARRSRWIPAARGTD